MESRLKERLTGAAILVALIVMVVPEMFHGQGNDVATLPGSSGEGPPLRSYTIDLSNSPTRTVPLQSTPVRGGSSADKGGIVLQVEPLGVPRAAAPAAPAAPVVMPVAPAPAAPAAAAPATPPATAVAPKPTASESSASTAPAAAAAPVAAAPAPAPKASVASSAAGSAPAAASRHAGDAGWMVQLGLFAKRENAERLALKAQGHGFPVAIAGADAKGLYRVYAGGMADRSAAEAYAQRLKDQGLPAAVVASP